MGKIGKVCIITGASCGVGYKTSKKMAALGYEIVLACRDKSKAKLAISKIKRDLPEANLIYMNLDLASFNSIKQFVKNFQNSGKKLNVLINNAAWMDKNDSRVPTFTEDGIEKTFAINYLGHFLLTLLLSDILKSAAKFDHEARILIISSAVAKKGRQDFLHMDMDNIQLLKPNLYNGNIAYKNSNVASILFGLELHRRLQGSGVTCNVVNPGKYVRSTSLFRNQGCLRKYIFPCFYCCSGISLVSAANAVVFLATNEELSKASGRYFIGCEESASLFEQHDLQSAKQLWELSEGMVASVL